MLNLQIDTVYNVARPWLLGSCQAQLACSFDFSFEVFIGNLWGLNRPIHILGKKKPANPVTPHGTLRRQYG